MYLLLLFFFFKQKTAYEMRISDWSSDVCSSDLSSAALPIFGEFMADALSGKEVQPFRIPPGVSLVRVNPSTGRPAQLGEPALWEAFRPGTEPFGTAAPAGSFTQIGRAHVCTPVNTEHVVCHLHLDKK